MNTDYISISSDLKGKEDALATAEKFITYNAVSGKDAIHVRLLTEEMLSLVNGIMDDFKAKLRLESEPSKQGVLCRIRLSARKSVSEKQENRLMSVSSSGKNEAAKGVLGKIREMFRLSAQHSADGVYAPGSVPMLDSWYSLGMHHDELSYMNEYAMGCWSLNNYRRNIETQKSSMQEEWDELEKSIINRLADDVKIYLKNDSTEIVIEKTLKP